MPKDRARRRLLARAVTELTERRSSASILREDEVQETIEYARWYMSSHGIRLVSDAELDRRSEQWKALQASEVSSKRPADLRVLYLCGPEPTNDLQILTGLGILPERVWAVEADREMHGAALNALSNLQRPPHIHYGKVEDLFENYAERFDIVYLDACGSIFDRNRNVSPLVALLVHQRLAALGALVTTFAAPAEEKRGLFTFGMAQYFSPRHRDLPDALHRDGVDPVHVEHDPALLVHAVERNFDACYSDFLTRLIVDLAREAFPLSRVVATAQMRRAFFANDEVIVARIVEGMYGFSPRQDGAARVDGKNSLADAISRAGIGLLAPSALPLWSFLRAANADPATAKLFEPIFSYRIHGKKVESLIPEAATLGAFVEGGAEAASKALREAMRGVWFDRGQIFCDHPFPHLLVNALLGFYARPWLLNPRASDRVRFVSKSTAMYSDCLVLDQCRAFFDMIPSVELMPSVFRDVALQIVLRACLDRMGRHDWASSTQPFRGAALAGFGEIECARAFDLDGRESI